MTNTSTHLDSLPFAGDLASFPTHAELTRTLLATGGFGTLTTITESGHPYGSLAAYSVLPDGSPLVCISELAEHTRNARRDPSAGLFVSGRAAPPVDDPMDAPRVSLVGTLRPVEPTPEQIARHLDVHPSTADYADWDDFHWWQLGIDAARYVGGFGIMSWIDGDAVAGATPDPVIAHAGPAIAHMNADHADANLTIARCLGGIADAVSARVRDIDRAGITFSVDTPGGMRVARVAFGDGPIADPDEIRSAVVALTHRARTAAEEP